MATTQDVHAPSLAANGQPCPSCGAPMAGDQRYCLQCGARRGDARVPYRAILAGQAPPPRTPIAAPPQQRGPSSGLALLVGLVCLLLALGVGVLIGRSGNDAPTAAAPAPAPAPQVISVGGAAPAATTPTATTPTATTPTATTPAATTPTTKGASSSRHSKSTNKSLKDLNNSSGSDYQKKSQKLPKQVDTGGKPPPKDNKPAGGGTDFQTIG